MIGTLTTMAARLGTVRDFVPVAPGDPGPAAVAAYREDGVVCLRGAFGPDWLDEVERGIEAVMANPGPDSGRVQKRGEAGFFFYDSLVWRRNPSFEHCIFQSHAADLFGAILETGRLNFYYDFLLVKSPHCETGVTPWHQDHSYYPLNGRKIVNCWTALDPIPAETALRFVKGSHASGPLYRAVHFSPGEEYPQTMKDRPPPPSFEQDPAFEILSRAMEPGDTLVWNSRTVHSAPGNHLDRRRAAYSTNWAGDDVTYNDIPQQSDPAYRGENLVQGGPITCETFPLVRGGE